MFSLWYITGMSISAHHALNEFMVEGGFLYKNTLRVAVTLRVGHYIKGGPLH